MMENTAIKSEQIPVGDMVLSAYKPGGWDRTGESDHSPLHFHAQFELHYLLEGQLSLKDDWQTYTVQAGDCLFIPPNLFHSNNSNSDAFVRYALSFAISPGTKPGAEFSEYLHYSRIFRSIQKVTVLQMPQAEPTVRRILSLGAKPEAPARHRLQAELLQLFYALADAVAASSPSTPSSGHTTDLAPDEEWHRMLIENCLNEFYTEPDLIGRIAERLCFSRRHAARMVQALYGETASALARRIRIRVAGSLIENTALHMTDIAEAVGYRSYTAFYTAFKTVRGIAPDDLRNGAAKPAK